MHKVKYLLKNVNILCKKSLVVHYLYMEVSFKNINMCMIDGFMRIISPNNKHLFPQKFVAILSLKDLFTHRIHNTYKYNYILKYINYCNSKAATI